MNLRFKEVSGNVVASLQMQLKQPRQWLNIVYDPYLVASWSTEARMDSLERTSNNMTAAIFYHPDAYSTAGPKLMGRQVAGASFLRGLLEHAQVSHWRAQVENSAHAQQFHQAVQAAGRSEPVEAVYSHNIAGLKNAGLVFHPGPLLARASWQRAVSGHTAWSLCGITHTTSSEQAMDALVEMMIAPVQPWDALICTSTAVKDNVERLLQAQVNYLEDRLGITKLVLPQMPVIPLGIHTKDFVFTPAQKAQARARLGVDDHTLVVLFMGRLSFHAKAHPLAMYQALEAAAQATGKKVVLVECGWHANAHIEKAYADAARLACPSVRVVTLDGRQDEQRQTAWAGADVFCSLSDNIQETFGITPIEAMAAGLPVVVSDWDGYKDTVRDVIDGFRIPTWMPQPGMGADLALRHALGVDTYDMYCGNACSLVAVDVQATTKAFVRLFESQSLRHQMGEAGRKHAQKKYDWSAIIPQYEALWAQQNELRMVAQGDTAPSESAKLVTYPWPARQDPFHAFAAYPTRSLDKQTMLCLVDADAETALKRTLAYRQLAMVDFAKVVLPAEDEIQAVIHAAANGPKPAIELLAHVAEKRKALVFRGIAWLMKLNVLRVAP